MTNQYSVALEGTANSGDVLNSMPEIINGIGNAASHFKTGSLVSATSSARVEPIVIVDQDCLFLEYLPDVLQSTQSIFVGYWLQALSLITNVGDVNVREVLDQLNPNRKIDTMGFFKEIFKIAKEEYSNLDNYKWKLPKLSQESLSDLVNFLDGKEKKDNNNGNNKYAVDHSRPLASDRAVGEIKDLTNLSIGKIMNVTIKNNGQEAVIPISFRLMVNTLPSSSIIQLLSTGAIETSLKERYFKWRAGRISFIKDLIFCQDLIREQKKALMTDKDGIYSEIQRRAKNSKLAGFFSLNPSLAEASNIVVMSENTSNLLKLKSNLNINNFRDRQKIFDKTYAMIMVHIDRNYERINFFHYGIQTSTSVGLRDLKVANKGNNTNIMDILNAFKKGDAPTF